MRSVARAVLRQWRRAEKELEELDKEYRQIEPILARKFSPVWAGLSDVLSDKSA